MSSKEQLPRQQQNLSPVSSQSTTQSLIFVNVDFNGSDQDLLQGLRPYYSGVKRVVKLYHQDNDGKFIRAIQINMKSDKLAQEFIAQGNFRIFDKEYAIQTLPKSLIVSKVGSNEKLGQILQDLTHNYMGIERISRFYDVDKKVVDQIRIDFKFESTFTKIIKDDYILIDGKRRSIQPYRSLTYIPKENQNENGLASQEPVIKESSKPASKNSQNYLTERRVKELFTQQQMQLEAMINQFESKWNARLSSLTASSTNANVDQLVPIFKELSMVCQQFNQQNAQVQKQLGALVHRVKDIQMKLNEEQQHSQLPIQNGH